MTKSITLKLPELLEQQLTHQAKQLNISLELLIIEILNQNKREQKGEYDPITPLIGTLKMDKDNLAQNHDFYLTETLQQELESVE